MGGRRAKGAWGVAAVSAAALGAAAAVPAVPALAPAGPGAAVAAVPAPAVVGPAADGATRGDRASAATAERQAAYAAKRRRTRVKLIETRFGSVLADGKGFVLYLFTRDQEEKPAEGRERSRCYGACARAWPVFRKRGRLRAGKGVSRELLGSVRRRKGRRQVTYAGHPLYYYVGDRRPGQVLCQDVREFGGIWYVVQPDGEPVL